MADELSQLLNGGNKNNTHESKYIMETISEIFDIDELPKGKFHITCNILYQYQQKNTGLTTELSCKKLENEVLFLEEGIIV